jgi:hypothetical protein
MQTTLLEQIKAYKERKEIIGNYSHCSGFYDWFCKDTSLEAKGKSLMNKVIKLIESGRVNINAAETYVFFKNNCPFNGSLYDSFSIVDKDGDVILWATPKSGHNGKAEIMFFKGDRNGQEVGAESFRELLLLI